MAWTIQKQKNRPMFERLVGPLGIAPIAIAGKHRLPPSA
ncbi:hypothetical protein C943_04131 [Mariniradius saccharolyticus AK6]|uniref:Uncharacterized protein n=1 Tax=Mariniradius saccharolyticus AK6 TaxID=1239962 RepID=M7XZA2_9BACT|nr:hypothetical protein C943_04131 [Mariniradius saccharolyticus AK6]